MSPDRTEAFLELLRCLKRDFSNTADGRALLTEWCGHVAALPGCAEFAALLATYLMTGEA